MRQRRPGGRQGPGPRPVGGSLDLETRAGVKHLELHADDRGGVDRVTVDMGAPVLEEERTLDVDGEPVTATILSMGNPTRWCSWTTSTRRR